MKILKRIILALTPNVLKKAIIHEFKIGEFNIDQGFHQITFSQQGEDLVIRKYFEEKNNGFYVDIGAFDPVTLSNTHLLYKKGWKGINIDPNPNVIKKFNNIRKGDINLQLAISDDKKTFSYHIFNYGAVNTLSEVNAKEWSNVDGFSLIDKVPVTTCRLEEVLQTHLPTGISIDFMNIDAEGFDLQVLKSNNWQKFRPSLIMIEESLKTQDDFANSEIVEFLMSHDYTIYTICNGSVAFIDMFSTIYKK